MNPFLSFEPAISILPCAGSLKISITDEDQSVHWASTLGSQSSSLKGYHINSVAPNGIGLKKNIGW
jgi:hypothetical protein